MGQGTYKIRFRTLILDFAVPDNVQQEGFEIMSYSNSEDSITINITVTEGITGEPLRNIVSAYIANLSLGVITDSLGQIMLKLPKSNKTQSLSISCIGYQELKIPINMSQNHKIDATLGMKVYWIEKGQIKYKIIKRSKKSLILKKDGRKIYLRNYSYRGK